MLRWLLLSAFVLPLAACHGAPPRAARAEPTGAAAPAPAPAPEPASASACRAEPSTVYGQEPVTFRIEAARAAQLEVTLVDELGRPLAKSTVAVPGTFQPPSVPSGDFTLRAGPGAVACAVTVNRELSRASQAPR
ncbi:MAG: hypothetical protein EOO73_32325 [Myxococcales bacterium]|nr:MAG: hypothetical protein EOO73_32325 [Myxococcales bacterium]